MMFTDGNAFKDLTGRYGFTVVEVRLSIAVLLLPLTAAVQTINISLSSPIGWDTVCRSACPQTTPLPTYCGMLSQSALRVLRGS